MTVDLFNAAQAELSLADVFMRKCTFCVDDAYEHRNGDFEFDTQYRHHVSGIEQLTPAEGSDADKLFRAFVEVAIRWGEDRAPENAEADEETFTELGRIEAVFVAEYTQKSDVPEECLHAFAMRAPSFHVWPYWREFVASTCARLNVPKIVIPPMSMAQNAKEDPASLAANATTSTRELYVSQPPKTEKPKKRGK